jgi:hypothetical protein
MKIHQIKKIFIVTCFSLIGFTVFAYMQSIKSKDDKRSLFCRNAKPLTEIEVNQYDPNGVKNRGGTLFKKVSLPNKRELPVIVFPESLSRQTWSKLPQSSIQYIGKGGDNTWQEWLHTDYFYLFKNKQA